MAGQWCSWIHDEETVPLDAEHEVQRTIKTVELTVFLCLFRKSGWSFKKEVQQMSLFVKFFTEGREKVDEVAKKER